MKCPVCGGAELVLSTQDLPYTYKGKTTTLPAVTGDFCDMCGDMLLAGEQADRLYRLMRAFANQVDDVGPVKPSNLKPPTGEVLSHDEAMERALQRDDEELRQRIAERARIKRLSGESGEAAP